MLLVSHLILHLYVKIKSNINENKKIYQRDLISGGKGCKTCALPTGLTVFSSDYSYLCSYILIYLHSAGNIILQNKKK